MNILTTGILSGLGRYVYEHLGGLGLTRASASRCLSAARKTGVDVIIHCAFNSSRDISSENLYDYFRDNVGLTEELAGLTPKKFIYISSVDVYPRNSGPHTEEAILEADSIKGIYGVTKMISEAIVKKYCKNFLILRPVTLLGRYARKNTLMRIIEGKDCSVGLSAGSRFNYALHEDVFDFIKVAIKKDLRGIYNVASSENIILSDVARIVGRKVNFGKYLYDVGNVSNAKISRICPAFRKSSAEALRIFLKGL